MVIGLGPRFHRYLTFWSENITPKFVTACLPRSTAQSAPISSGNRLAYSTGRTFARFGSLFGVRENLPLFVLGENLHRQPQKCLVNGGERFRIQHLQGMQGLPRGESPADDRAS
jgi:hypothetical protein